MPKLSFSKSHSASLLPESINNFTGMFLSLIATETFKKGLLL